MRFAVVYSKKDLAGVNIAKQLKEIGFAPQMPVIELKKHPIYSENMDKDSRLKNIDFIVFASTHKSEKNQPSLSLHAPGNWRGADFGGRMGKVCSTSAFVLKYLFQELNKNAKELAGYEITLECTHHGPFIETPCCFIEIGSTDKEWGDEGAGKVIAKTILSLQNYKQEKNWVPCIGVGGPHYCPGFNKIQLSSKYAIGHVVPGYVFPLTENMFKEAEKKTKEQIKEVLLDWKGCGKSEERQRVVEIVGNFGLGVKRTGEVEK